MMQVHGQQRGVSSEPSNASREMERGLLMASSDAFEAKVQPSMLLSQHCGNMYAGDPGLGPPPPLPLTFHFPLILSVRIVAIMRQACLSSRHADIKGAARGKVGCPVHAIYMPSKLESLSSA